MNEPTAAQKWSLGLFALAVFLLCAHGAALGNAPASVRLRLTRDGAVMLARVCANEDSRPLRGLADHGTAGVPTEDCLAIAQTVRGFARWAGKSHLRALRMLAPHVTGLRPATNPRHQVYGALPALGGARPPGWVDARDGDWRVHGPLWERLRDNVVAFVADGAFAPCPQDPVAWGCEADEHIARARRLVRLPCGSSDRFYVAPKSVLVLR